VISKSRRFQQKKADSLSNRPPELRLAILTDLAVILVGPLGDCRSELGSKLIPVVRALSGFGCGDGGRIARAICSGEVRRSQSPFMSLWLH
jgi:hypothetical protein